MLKMVGNNFYINILKIHIAHFINSDKQTKKNSTILSCTSGRRGNEGTVFDCGAAALPDNFLWSPPEVISPLSHALG